MTGGLGGAALLASSVLFPIAGIGLGALSIASYLLKNKLMTELEKWEEDHIDVHRIADPTHEISLKSNIEYGKTPWLFYSEDGVKWHVEKCTMVGENEWRAKIKTEGSIQYKFLKCPSDMDPMNIIREGIWQKTNDGQNVCLSKETLDSQSINEEGLRVLPSCNYPDWEG